MNLGIGFCVRKLQYKWIWSMICIWSVMFYHGYQAWLMINCKTEINVCGYFLLLLLSHIFMTQFHHFYVFNLPISWHFHVNFMSFLNLFYDNTLSCRCYCCSYFQGVPFCQKNKIKSEKNKAWAPTLIFLKVSNRDHSGTFYICHRIWLE